MPLEGHLDELRRRLTYSAIVLLPIFVALFVVHQQIIILVVDSGRPYISKGLVAISPQEVFFTFMKVDFFLSLVVASPFWLYQALAFFLPAFSRHARYLVLRLLPIMIALFLVGVLFGFRVLLPLVLRFLTGFGGSVVADYYTLGNYVSFALGITLPPGFLFEMPLVAYGLASVGLVTSAMLVKGWRFAILGAAILSAVFAPPGPLPMLALGLPILGLYQASIMVASVTGRRRERRLAAEGAEEEDANDSGFDPFDGDTGG